MWNELTFLWNELTILWNDLTIDWNDLTWNDLTMERNDRIPLCLYEGTEISQVTMFSASFQTFCLTARAYLNTQKYGLFCSLRDLSLLL